MTQLKKMRIQNNLSCQDMANLLQISKTYYWQIENNHRNLSYEMAIKIASIFKTKPDHIFYDEYIQKNK